MDQMLISKKEIVEYFLDKELLLDEELLKDATNNQEILNKIKKINIPQNLVILSKKIIETTNKESINWTEIDNIDVLNQKGRTDKSYDHFIDCVECEIKEPIKPKNKQVEIICSHTPEEKKRCVGDFVKYFNKRYKALENILKNRQELQNLTSINRVVEKKEREATAVVGMVSKIHLSKNKNYIINIEDQTGNINVVINKNKPEIYESAKSLVLDEVIGVVGVGGQNVIFANKVIWPEIPSVKEFKKSPDLCYAAFLSDLHVGSGNFLQEEFEKFIKWMNGEVGNEEQRELAKNIKYLFIVGDLVDGVGIYPNQDEELNIKDVYEQYRVCGELLNKIPKSVNIIMCAGNHDALRIAEPQPVFYKDFSKPLWDISNATIVSNPAYVNIHSSEHFSGFDVLMYHGYSFDYYVNNVDILRNNGGYNRIDLMLKFLLQKRHLAPTHASTLYLPDTESDPLVINKVPDFFITGHIHKSMAANHKNITLISGSCWQSKTGFQEKVGHTPEPARVPVVNLQTREVKIMRFG